MDGAKALAPALVALPRLSHVSLSQCDLGPQGAACLAPVGGCVVLVVGCLGRYRDAQTRNLRHALLVARFVRATVLPSGSVAVQASLFVFDISLQELTGGSESKSSELSLVAARV